MKIPENHNGVCTVSYKLNSTWLFLLFCSLFRLPYYYIFIICETDFVCGFRAVWLVTNSKCVERDFLCVDIMFLESDISIWENTIKSEKYHLIFPWIFKNCAYIPYILLYFNLYSIIQINSSNFLSFYEWARVESFDLI